MIPVIMRKPKNHKPKKKKQTVRLPPSKRHKPKYVWLNVLPDDLWIRVRRGKTIWEALQKAAVHLEGDCGGLGKCGKCKVKVLSFIGPPSKEATELLTEEEIKDGLRLTCRNKIKKDLVIYLGEPQPDQEFFQILKTGYRPPLQLDPLIDKRLVTISPELQKQELSEMDRIRRAMGPEGRNLQVPLHCLRTLPQIFGKTSYHGAVVLHENSMLAWQDWESVGRRYGLVFDIGTSTVVGKLISLLDGHEVAAISHLNSQIRHGTNVISRLQFIKDNKDGLKRLHDLLLKDMRGITQRLLEVGELRPEEIFIAVAAGNTTMQHILLALDPSGIAEAPFSPIITEGIVVKAEQAGLKLHPEALLYVMPAKSGYIGGDLISVILASEAAEQDSEMILGLDLGTNGEIFLGNRSRLLTCSTAAGPALEGARISHGAIARVGAIEAVRMVDGQIQFQIIGNVKPKGICGSGLVDLVAVLLHCGIIDCEGLIHPTTNEDTAHLNGRLVENSGVYDFLIASPEESHNGRPIYLKQNDVRELQLAKGAIAAGIRSLMHEMKIEVGAIRHIYLAGALGNYINPFSAMRIGLIPTVNPDIVKSIGNAASTGASMVLLCRNSWHMAKLLADFIDHVELSHRADFNQHFIEHMDFPRDNLW